MRRNKQLQRKNKQIINNLCTIAICAIFRLIISGGNLWSQYDHIPVANPVYSFLERAEAKGYLKNMSLAIKPMMRYEVIEAIKKIRLHQSELTELELSTLEKYERYFEIIPEEKLVVFYSNQDTSQVLSTRFFDNNTKYVFHYDDGEHNLYLSPLLSLDNMTKIADAGKDNVLYTNFGFRLNGTLGNLVGYYLQATNGEVIKGERNILKLDDHISSNVKFTDLNSDFDFMESGVNLKYKWLYLGISKESRQWGSGIMSSMYVSNYAPTFTAFDIGVNFGNFSYLFTHGSLLAHYRDSIRYGFGAMFPDKYIATHRFAITPSWGEFALWEGVIYSKRGIDLNYLNPLSFIKALEHSLRDRDNTMLGFDFTVRPVSNLELKGTFILDDIIFSEVGRNHWSNKTAWNVGMWYSPDIPVDFGFEYSRLEPYTFSHFDYLNNYSNDSRLINTQMQPNSDQFAGIIKFWWGQKTPLQLKLAYIRHGENTYDANGKLIKNVGGDFNHTRYMTDSERPYFLDGIRNDILSFDLNIGYELFRDFYAKLGYTYHKSQLNPAYQLIKISFTYENF